jgi:hypothetical protein
MRFVPAHKQSDEANPVYSHANWPVEFVLIVNDKDRETFVCHDRIQQILSPAIQATCLLTAAQKLLFPTPPSGGRFGGHLHPLPRRLLPTSPAIPAQTSPLGPATPPSRTPPGNPNLEIRIQRLDTHSYAPYPMPLREPVGIGIPHEVAIIITATNLPTTHEPRHLGRGNTSFPPLPDLEDKHVFPSQHAGWVSPSNGEAPAPYPWPPRFLPEQWVCTDGSDITGHPRLGAAVVHTTIYIDVAGTEETRTIMRAKLVAIHTDLTTFSTHD